jgi:hypothetical protein
MKYFKPLMIPLDGMLAAGLCNNGSAALDNPAKCASGVGYTDVSCHEGSLDSLGGCFAGSGATGLICAGGFSATAGQYALCSSGGDDQ